MKKVRLFLLLTAISLVFSPVAFAQDEEPTPDATGEDETVTVVDEDGNEVQAVITPFVEGPPAEEEPGFAVKDTVVQLLVAAFAACVVISQTVNELKVREVIEDGKAGTWVKNISLAISAISQVLTFLGEDVQLVSVEDGAVGLANTIVIAVVFVLGSNLVHYLGKKTGASFSFSLPAG